MDWLETLDPHWFWLTLGLVLAIGEMTIPGVFLIWLSAAALVTGAVSWLVPIGIPLQIVLFAVLAVVFVFAGRNWLQRNPVKSADPQLNDRGGQAIGQVVLVTHAIDAAGGRVKLGDSEWMARGPDAEPGTRMRVSGHDGSVLLVEHMH